jgi:hypothetical protein
MNKNDKVELNNEENNEDKNTEDNIDENTDDIDETIGVSFNNNDWKIHEYKNHTSSKEYTQEYNTIKFDIKNEILEKCDKKIYIKDNK